jgi:dihydrofolate reductase
MTLSMIVAISENGVIGNEDALPWRLSEDLKRFKRLTMGHHILMGRKTFESIGRALPGRTSVIITRQPDYDFAGVTDNALVAAGSLEDAIQLSSQDDEAFVIGGAEIYRQAFQHVDRLYLTRVHAEVAGDTRFPEFDLTAWQLREETRHAADEKNHHEHSFQIYERIRQPRTVDVNAGTTR